MDEWIKLILGVFLMIVGSRLRGQNKEKNQLLSNALMIIGILLVLVNFIDLLT